MYKFCSLLANFTQKDHKKTADRKHSSLHVPECSWNVCKDLDLWVRDTSKVSRVDGCGGTPPTLKHIPKAQRLCFPDGEF